MAVNLDKEAYYRRIKRLYGNWKVKLGVRRLVRVQSGVTHRNSMLEDASRASSLSPM